MSKDAMITVKVAASLLSLDERTVRERLANGTLKGEKLSHGQREKWYVHTSAIESELKHKQQMENAADSLKKFQQNDTHGLASDDLEEDRNLNFEPDIESTVDVEAVIPGATLENWRSAQADQLELIAEKLLKPMTERIEMQAVALAEKDRVIEEKERQLRLLPDLQKQAEIERHTAQNKALEIEALKKQIAALDQKQAAALEQERKAAEMSEQAWKEQIAALKEKQAATIEQERRVAEAANAEVERIKAEKEAEAKAIQEQLAALSAQLQDLKQPKLSWWQKWFVPSKE